MILLSHDITNIIQTKRFHGKMLFCTKFGRVEKPPLHCTWLHVVEKCEIYALRKIFSVIIIWTKVNERLDLTEFLRRNGGSRILQFSQYSVTVWKLREFSLTLFRLKFCESNIFFKEITKELISEFFFVIEREFLVFLHCECGNVAIFLLLIFYVKSFWVISEVQKLSFGQFFGIRIFISERCVHFVRAEIDQNLNLEPLSLQMGILKYPKICKNQFHVNSQWQIIFT